MSGSRVAGLLARCREVGGLIGQYAACAWMGAAAMWALQVGLWRFSKALGLKPLSVFGPRGHVAVWDSATDAYQTVRKAGHMIAQIETYRPRYTGSEIAVESEQDVIQALGRLWAEESAVLAFIEDPTVDETATVIVGKSDDLVSLSVRLDGSWIEMVGNEDLKGEVMADFGGQSAPFPRRLNTTPSQVEQVLVVYLTTGSLPTGLVWQ